jgi:F-box/leucine-rich repeat protein 2/20
MSLRLNSTPKITSFGLLSVVVGCKSLCALHLVDCHKIGSTEWLEYLGWNGILEELVLKNCEGISQYDLLKFGPGWMKLKKFEFQINAGLWDNLRLHDLSYDAHNPSRYDFFCESLKDLRLARFTASPEVGLRNLLGKCKALEKLCLEYVHGLNDNDMIVLSQSCSNLRSISLWLTPLSYGYGEHRNWTTPFTDNSLKALALNCPMLESVELTFAACSPSYPSEIGFTQKGLVALIKSCPIRVLVLNGANFFDDEGMRALSFAPFLETLELMGCEEITDVGMQFIVDIPSLSNLAFRWCELVTDGGMAELMHAQKLDSLSIEQCPHVSLEAVQGAARSVHYSIDCVSHSLRGQRMFIEDCS